VSGNDHPQTVLNVRVKNVSLRLIYYLSLTVFANTCHDWIETFATAEMTAGHAHQQS